jgi:hypothetical protein
MPFTGLTNEMCVNAFEIACNGLYVAYDLGVANKYAGTIVVINPFILPSSSDPSMVDLDEVRRAALFISRVNEAHADVEKYDELALVKARDMWVLNHFFGITSNRDIQQNYPHLYRPGMTKWHGGTCRDGIVIGFSGVQGNYDEAMVEMVSTWLTAMCREEMTKPDGVMASDSAYIALSSGPSTHEIGRAAVQRRLDH